jgi:hypothetical protein
MTAISVSMIVDVVVGSYVTREGEILVVGTNEEVAEVVVGELKVMV